MTTRDDIDMQADEYQRDALAEAASAQLEESGYATDAAGAFTDSMGSPPPATAAIKEQ